MRDLGCGMTTTPQTKASRLVEMADELERVCHDWTIAHIASAELRRLVAENSDLRERNAALETPKKSHLTQQLSMRSGPMN